MNRKARRTAEALSRAVKTTSRYASIHYNTLYQPTRKRTPGSPPRVFNLDLHVSVIADLGIEFKRRQIDLTSWSISGHNFIQRKIFTTSDPVRVVNAKTWRQLDENMIDQFQDIYGRYLRSFDGFVACFTPTFAELFRGLDRPTLTMAATRYEAPYTTDPNQWLRFNEYVRAEVNSGHMILAANNRGDRDYCEHFMGITPRYVPSLCDYTSTFWTGSSGVNVIQSTDQEVIQKVVNESRGFWQDGKTALKSGHSWDQLASIKEIFIIPYNISTMTLFELATLGVPVSVPSRRFLKDLAGKQKGGALSQLTWFQVHGTKPPAGFEDPNNSDREDFLDWWIDRADFYDPDLMPNVRVIDSITELFACPHPVTTKSKTVWTEIVRKRNFEIDKKRSSLISDFTRMMK